MTDAEKCRLIAEFEMPHQRWATNDDDYYLPDYPHDLNATMRAARRLPEDSIFRQEAYRGSDGRIVYSACITFGVSSSLPKWHSGDTAARAAFEALAAWLMERGK